MIIRKLGNDKVDVEFDCRIGHFKGAFSEKIKAASHGFVKV